MYKTYYVKHLDVDRIYCMYTGLWAQREWRER